MTTWTSDELNQIEQADELEIAPLCADGSLRHPTPIWVVREGDDVYVRAYRGRGGVWFRAAQVHHQGRIQSGGVDKDVSFIEESDPAVNERIDATYRSKYRNYGIRYVDSIVAETARAATLRLMPR